ncbi:hypothetical protein MZM54_06440 [[Brevibacterium] frigoritolerans]|nr:hypothetical protein [Peribacillus frigoritolerans]
MYIRRKIMVVSFYLVKFNRKAYRNLGYDKIIKGHDEFGRKLGYKGNSVKNRRDDFDPLREIVLDLLEESSATIFLSITYR